MEILESPVIQLFVSSLCECGFESFVNKLSAHLAASLTEFPNRAKLRSAVAANSHAFVLEVVGERVIVAAALRTARNNFNKWHVGHCVPLTNCTPLAPVS
jgi:hypothetical protein